MLLIFLSAELGVSFGCPSLLKEDDASEGGSCLLLNEAGSAAQGDSLEHLGRWRQENCVKVSSWFSEHDMTHACSGLRERCGRVFMALLLLPCADSAVLQTQWRPSNSVVRTFELGPDVVNEWNLLQHKRSEKQCHTTVADEINSGFTCRDLHGWPPRTAHASGIGVHQPE